MAKEAKKPTHKRDVVYQVRDTTDSLRRCILKDAEDLDDENGVSIIRRIQQVPYYDAYDAQYHHRCRKQIKGDFAPESNTVKAKLMVKYGQDIIFSSNKKKKTIICFRNTGENDS